jgi:hypothetical protein
MLVSMTRTLRLTTVGWALVIVTAYRLITLIATLTYSDSMTALRVRNTASSTFAWWDGQWYLRIAQNGYDPHFWQHSALGRQTDAAFPPALASLMATTHRIFGIDYTVAGLIWGFLALIAIAVGLVQLIELDYGRPIALLTLIFLLLWPPAMFFGMLYQDGITLAGVVWAFLFVRRRKPVLAGIALAVGCLGKLVAVVALAALLVDYLHEARNERRYADLAALVGIPIATIAAWIVYSGIRFHHLTAALDVERSWGHELSTPWHSISVSAHAVHLYLPGYRAVLIGDFVAIALLLAATIYLAVRRARPAYVVHAATVLLALTTNGNTSSLSRYALLAFPMFLAAALAANWLYTNRRSAAITTGCAIVATALPIQFWLIARFARYYWAG